MCIHTRGTTDRVRIVSVPTFMPVLLADIIMAVMFIVMSTLLLTIHIVERGIIRVTTFVGMMIVTLLSTVLRVAAAV